MRRLTDDAAAVLRRGVAVLEQRGLAKGAVRNPATGQVDINGALQLACGVRFNDLTDDIAETIAMVPPANLPAFLEAWTAVDATVDGVEDWQDHPSTDVDDACSVMLRVAEVLERRVLP